MWDTVVHCATLWDTAFRITLQTCHTPSTSSNVYLTPEHHRWTLPEAVRRFPPPVGHHPLEGGVFEEHEQDTDEDSDDQEEVETGVLVEAHRRRLALQLAVVQVLVTLAPPEEHVSKVVREPTLVVLQDLPGQNFLQNFENQIIKISFRRTSGFVVKGSGVLIGLGFDKKERANLLWPLVLTRKGDKLFFSNGQN